MSPPDRAIVLCVDEKSQIQALDRSQPMLPMRPGQATRRTHDGAPSAGSSPATDRCCRLSATIEARQMRRQRMSSRLHRGNDCAPGRPRKASRLTSASFDQHQFGIRRRGRSELGARQNRSNQVDKMFYNFGRKHQVITEGGEHPAATAVRCDLDPAWSTIGRAGVYGFAASAREDDGRRLAGCVGSAPA